MGRNRAGRSGDRFNHIAKASGLETPGWRVSASLRYRSRSKPGACEYDGQAAHEEARSVRAPGVGIGVPRRAKIEKIIFIIPVKRFRHVLAARSEIRRDP